MTLYRGDPAPCFTAHSNVNPTFKFDTVAGRNIVLSFIGGSNRSSGFLDKFSSLAQYNDNHSSLFLVVPCTPEQTPFTLPLDNAGVRAFYDSNLEIHKLYGIGDDVTKLTTVILSPRLQVQAIVIHDDENEHFGAVRSIMETMPENRELPGYLTHAPVLIIPDVFEPELCKELIAGYNHHGGRVSGFMRDVDGKTVELQDSNHKVRRDWNIDHNPSEIEDSLIKAIQSRFLRRVIPEIKKAYQFEATRMERYLVACYRADEGGHFRAHRDNTTKGTAHRRFAVSLNLNTEEYEGGDLQFPEFGTNLYKPPTGGCCVFSCSLLHEAKPVTKGQRYAFLPFIYDEAARKIREENMPYIQTDQG